TCILDVLRHVPRCAFSDKQNSVIHWALMAMGVKDVPSERSMKDIQKVLQKMCGVQSLRFSGALGHIYYSNDLAAIVAQEISNPQVRPHLRFLPEDSGNRLSEAWQAQRWLHELDSSLTTPMIRTGGQDFYIYEPVLLHDGQVCMPHRWFTRGEEVLARTWAMSPSRDGGGWIVHEDHDGEVRESQLHLSLPHLIKAYAYRGLPDPRCIVGVLSGAAADSTDRMQEWTWTNPAVGNQWRSKAGGHHVVAFPIWLYCDDTSGNQSKKWNKHNSFLFTAAGLPRRFVHREFNIHFLATSNIAPPLEMLDGIVDQLKDCQESGIWAFDCVLKEWVVIIPSVLAMLGDNPMQSEMACHIGLMGKLFCRVCWVSGNPEEPNGNDQNARGDHDGDASDSSIHSAMSHDGDGSPDSPKSTSKVACRSKKNESMAEMKERIKQFMSIGFLRSRQETTSYLKSQLDMALRVGGFTAVKVARTATGIKDTFLAFFLDKLFKISKKRGKSKEKKQSELAQAATHLPPLMRMMSPVWRIQDLDPHADTPVEILHVILLGFVKYFSRDAMARLKDDQKRILIARLTSIDISGLGISPLAGATLVNYAGSLTG
ncbi:hypothetical protein NEOLEDRAFT_1048020, partial [Neolentinus lepideus HHB14362 ss-1]